jgi:hypothetical protein
VGGWDYRSRDGSTEAGAGSVVVRRELPALVFTDYAVAFHLAVEPPRARAADGVSADHELPRGEQALESYERDMLLYAYRHLAPLQTHALGSSLAAELQLPSELVFESEGKPIRLICADASAEGRVRSVRIVASATTFGNSGAAVATIVLRPGHGEPSSDLNEYDVIKLTKLWEGGERLPEPGSREEASGPVRFELDGSSLAFDDLVQLVLRRTRVLDYASPQLAAAIRRGPNGSGGRSPSVDDGRFTRQYRVGTLALKLPATEENFRLLSDADTIRESSEDADALDEVRWKRVRSLGGVLQGLLDFEDIGADELSDVFANAELDDGSLLAFHKGTLLSLTLAGSAEEEARESKLAEAIGMSPYLVVPHAVLLHNEQRLKWALIETNKVLARQGRDSRAIGMEAGRLTIEKTEQEIRTIEQARAQHIPNVFHYRSERELYEQGGTSRGFADFEPLLQSRLDELKRRLEVRQRQRERWTFGLTLAFFGIAALQLALTQVTKSVAWWAYLLVLLGLAGLVWWLRKRLF